VFSKPIARPHVESACSEFFKVPAASGSYAAASTAGQLILGMLVSPSLKQWAFLELRKRRRRCNSLRIGRNAGKTSILLPQVTDRNFDLQKPIFRCRESMHIWLNLGYTIPSDEGFSCYICLVQGLLDPKTYRPCYNRPPRRCGTGNGLTWHVENDLIPQGAL
jgi:hypothetical protein